MPYVQTGSSRTFYKVDGQGKPLLLLHGLGLSSRMWEPQVQALSGKYRVYRIDLIGHGDSSPCPEGCTLKEFIEQVGTFIDAVGVSRIHVVGFSLGALIAEGLAVEYPTSVASLSLVSCVGRRSESERAAVMKRVHEVERFGHRATIDAAIERWFTPGFIAEQPNVVSDIRAMLAANDPVSYLRAYQVFAISDTCYFERLDQIACPALVITGEGDIGSTPSMARSIAQRIRNARVEVVPGYRHMLPVEGWSVLNRKLLCFLKDCERAEEV